MSHAGAESRTSRSALRRSGRRRRYFARRRGRAGGGAAWLERRRQDDDAQYHCRSGAARARQHSLARREHFRRAGFRHRQQGTGAVAGRLAPVRFADCRAEPAAWRHRTCRPVASRRAVRARLCAVPAARRTAAAGGGHVVGRRAADAGARPRADERAAAAHARRADSDSHPPWSSNFTTRSANYIAKG